MSRRDRAAQVDGADEVELDRRWGRWYAVLTAAIGLPLLWAFVTVTNLYPIPAWSLFSETVDLGPSGSTLYRVLVGEFADGSEREIRPITLSDALTGRIHTMVRYVVDNSALQIPNPHPENARYLDSIGGVAALPPAARIPDLLHAWAGIYNGRRDAGDPGRLRALRLDEFYWPAQGFRDYREPRRSWRVVVAP